MRSGKVRFGNAGSGLPAASADSIRSKEIAALVYAVLVAGVCSIVYELLIATTVVYFLGDSVRYFSLTIGLYMAAMGGGAYISKYLRRNLLQSLILAEIALGAVGGFSVPLLYLAFSHDGLFGITYATLTLLVGFLIGLEVPLLTRLLERYQSLRVSIAHVLSLDYLGALAATLAFPFLLMPFFGAFRTSLGLGLLNMTIGLFLLHGFGRRLPRQRVRLLRLLSLAIALTVTIGLLLAHVLLAAWNRSVFDGRIIHAGRSALQDIVLTRSRHDLRLYLNGSLQFSSTDEHRYHEALVHVPLSLVDPGRQDLDILILGGGDGLAVREVLRHDRVRRITLVDPDPAVPALARENPWLRALNGDSMHAPQLRVVIDDAVSFLRDRRALYDVILADLPDPSSTDLARLYAREFYMLVRTSLAPDGIFAGQSTSPWFSNAAFWSIVATAGSVFDHVRPYHLPVPSFGDWGFTLASRRPLDRPRAPLPPDLRFLTPDLLPGLFLFPADLQPRHESQISSLDRPVVLRQYIDGWRQWSRD